MKEPIQAIDPDALRTIRVGVERVVRPVVAGELRKLRNRNELLGHASDAFVEERARGAETLTAARAAIARLGDPAELTAELQNSVSLADRWSAAVEWAIRRPRGGSYARHAAWMACLMGGMLAGLLTLGGLLASLGLGPPKLAFTIPMARTTVLLVWFYAATGAVGALVGGRVRDAMERAGNRLQWKPIGLALVGGVAIWIVGVAAWPIVGAPAQWWSPRFAASWTTLSVVFAVSTVVLSWLDIRERRELETWLELEIE